MLRNSIQLGAIDMLTMNNIKDYRFDVSDHMMKKIGCYSKSLRERLGLSVIDISIICDVTRDSIYKYERGELVSFKLYLFYTEFLFSLYLEEV